MKTVKKQRGKWKDEFYLRAYQLAKDGMSDAAIAVALGMEKAAFQHHIRRREALREALAKARDSSDGAVDNFHKFVYGRLPPNLQRLWLLIHKKKRDPGELLAEVNMWDRMQLFLYAFVACNFSVSEACRKLAMSKSIIDGWMKKPQFSELMKHMHQCKKDFFEAALIKLAKNGDTGAILFANRTLNRDRGYNDKVEVSIGGTVHHTHSLDELPLDIRKQWLQHVRDKAQKALPAPERDEEEALDAEYEEVPITKGGKK